jgi:hypothetical protein
MVRPLRLEFDGNNGTGSRIVNVGYKPNRSRVLNSEWLARASYCRMALVGLI